MSYEIEETGDLTRRATVEVPADDFKDTVDDILRDIAEDADIEGFREGNVPLRRIRRQYGRQAQQQAIEQAVRGKLEEIAEDLGDRLLHIGQPEVTDVPQEDEAGPLTFDIDIELRPDIDPTGYLGLEIERPSPEASDDDVDEQIERLREQQADLQPLEFRTEIEEGDVVTLDISPVDDDIDAEQLEASDVQTEVGSGQLMPEIEEALIGAEPNSTITVDLDAGANFPIEDLRGETVELEVTIKAVQTKVLPELNDEFAKQTGQAETLLELRSNIREEVSEAKSHRADHLAEENLMDELIAQHDFDIPPQFLDEQLERSVEQRKQQLQQQGIDLEQIELDESELRDQIRGEVENSIKSEFILLAIAEKEGLDVDESDLDEFFEHRAQHNPQVSAEQLRQVYQQDEQRWQQVQYQALMDKTRSFLLDEADVEEGEWPEQPGPGAAAGAAGPMG
jgi:trigger factor